MQEDRPAAQETGKTSPTSGRVSVKRLPQRGYYDQETLFQILDAGFVCHVAVVGEGYPRVIPTVYVRRGESVYLHGSPASQLLRTLASGGEACVCVTHVDGLVLARSAFHHSLNYRSAILFGRAGEVTEQAEKLDVLRAFVEQIVPGRWETIRIPSESEMKKTLVVSVPLSEASAKIRTGPPKDDQEDYALPVWAGVVPLWLAAGDPIPDPQLPLGTPLPGHMADLLRKHAG